MSTAAPPFFKAIETKLVETPRPKDQLSCVTWNIAAVNNNPFEYYTTMNDKRYDELMDAVGTLIESPGAADVPVGSVFTPAMFAKLQAGMEAQGWKGLDKVAAMYESDYSKRTIVAGFLKDADIGAKRLASMPDRFTNTINCADGRIVCRPTVINNYAEAMPDGDAWFAQWFAFFFETKLPVKDKKGEVKDTLPCAMLAPIKKAKYPAITEEEEAISIPLQLLCQGIFDATLVHMLNTLAPGAWHPLKMSICEALVVTKAQRTLAVIESPLYCGADVIFLQEVAISFIEAICASPMLSRYAVLQPKSMDAMRDQNSIILVAKCKLAGDATEVALESGAVDGLVDGDLCMYKVPLDLGKGGATDVLLAAFHGDTNGLQSTPVVNAVRKHAAGSPILMGLDANTHIHKDPKGKSKYVEEFVAELSAGDAPLAHSWAGAPVEWLTTFNSRTYLQPQLNKAVKFGDRLTSKLTDRNPKDFILFSQSFFGAETPMQPDNSGLMTFDAEMSTPTLTFPSDHAIVSSTIKVL